jgi:ketosteroid isomerase-like protein
MKTLAVTLTLTLALSAMDLTACDKSAEAATVDKAKITVSIKNDVHNLVEAFNGRNVAGAVSHDAPDYVFMFHGQPNVVGKEQDTVATGEMLKDPLVWLTLGNETVDVSGAGDMAVYRTTYKMRFTDPKTKRDGYEAGNWVIVYKQQPDGTWKVASNVVTDTPATK